MINQGATLQTPQGGQVLVFAPAITNEGTISTPGGQTMLAAGNQIFWRAAPIPICAGCSWRSAAPGAR